MRETMRIVYDVFTWASTFALFSQRVSKKWRKCDDILSKIKLSYCTYQILIAIRLLLVFFFLKYIYTALVILIERIRKFLTEAYIQQELFR